jgi:response regulator RpfG family c-di-GMP phosphodiesterase
MSAPESHQGIILVADDNEANRELLSAMLSAEGYQVVCAADGQQALKQVDSDSIDLALLDVVMPRPTGFEICQAMKSKPETRLIPVILLTSLNSDADRIHGILCGADDFLNKPVNKHELLARVHSLLRLKQFTDELDNAETVLFSLALTIEAKDPHTEGHCDRLSKYSVALGDNQERPIIRHHHEKQDGSGYPDGLKGAHDGKGFFRGKRLAIGAVRGKRVINVRDLKDPCCERNLCEEVKRGWWDGSILDEFKLVVDSYVPVQPAGSVS